MKERGKEGESDKERTANGNNGERTWLLRFEVARQRSCDLCYGCFDCFIQFGYSGFFDLF